MSKDKTSEGSSSGPLQISPTELIFPPPLNRVITNILKLTNPNEKSVAFKVKTTAPKRYCVRPNTGLIHPKETVEVQILLNPSKDKPTTLSAKDKFQVQSFFLKDDQISLDLKELWTNISPEEISKQKLKCSFGSDLSNSRSSSEYSKTVSVFCEPEENFPNLSGHLGNVPEVESLDSMKPSPSTSTPSSPPLILSSSSSSVENSNMNSSSSMKIGKEEDLKTLLLTTMREKEFYQQQVKLLNEKIQKENEKQLKPRKPPLEAIDTPTKSTSISTQKKNLDYFNNPVLHYVIIAIIFFILGKFF